MESGVGWNQAENSLEIPIREESGEGRAQGASWPPESGWGQALSQLQEVISLIPPFPKERREQG